MIWRIHEIFQEFHLFVHKCQRLTSWEFGNTTWVKKLTKRVQKRDTNKGEKFFLSVTGVLTKFYVRYSEGTKTNDTDQNNLQYYGGQLIKSKMST